MLQLTPEIKKEKWPNARLTSIDKIQNTNPNTYKLKDLNGEEIKDSFYKLLLQGTAQ